MRMIIRASILMLLALASAGSHAQTNRALDFDARIDAIRSQVSISPTVGKRAAIPERNYVPQVYCNEFIPFKDGYIINSIATQPGNLKNASYDFYYIDLKKNKLEIIKTELADTIYSIVAVRNDVYLSGIKNKKTILLKISPGKTTELPLSIHGNDFTQVGDSSWTKLAFYKDQLYLLQRNGTFSFKNPEWTSIGCQTLDEFYRSVGLKSPKSIIPTENIYITNNKLNFFQEVTLQRTSYLFQVGLEKGAKVSEFFSRHKLADNTQKEVMSVDATEQQTLVAMQRIQTNSYLFLESEGKPQALLVNNYVSEDNGELNPVEASAVKIFNKDSVFVGAKNGIFGYGHKHFNPLILFDNAEQTIQLSKQSFVFQFVPRSIIQLEPEKFLVGGLFGGLYIMDTKRKSIRELDDVKKISQEDVFAN